MRLTVLSPHRDDAAFSLTLALRRWAGAGVEITVFNFFTRSAYAPYAPAAGDVPAIRAREDRRSLKSIGAQIRVHSLSLLDAPVRLPINFGAITNIEAFSPLAEEVDFLSHRMWAKCRNALVLAPLALGDHIDHRTVHRAALRAAGAHCLGFYEDLPYAAWTDEASIRKRVSRAEAQLGVRLFPALQRSAAWRLKERVISHYHSQIDAGMARTIARYSEKYKGAERIWVPLHSARWRAILNL
jgi:LmbE family N-acetylglucosaminyl deacetylase